VVGYTAMSICGSTNPDFTLSGSSTLSAATFPMSGDLSNAFFDEVAYRGATGSADFTDGWTGWDPQEDDCAFGKSAAGHTGDIAGLELVPNPAHDQTHAIFPAERAGLVHITITDKITRRMLRSYTIKAQQAGRQDSSIDLSGLEPGLYIFEVKTGGQRFHQQLVIN
jgi:hypothetical protein